MMRPPDGDELPDLPECEDDAGEGQLHDRQQDEEKRRYE